MPDGYAVLNLVEEGGKSIREASLCSAAEQEMRQF